MKKTMEKILEHCSATVGLIISILFYVLMFAVVFAPVLMIDLPSIWLNLLLACVAYFVMFCLPLLWPIVQLILWIVSIPYALHTALGGFLIFYLVCAALYICLDLIQFIVRFISGFLSD